MQSRNEKKRTLISVPARVLFEVTGNGAEAIGKLMLGVVGFKSGGIEFRVELDEKAVAISKRRTE